MANPDNLSQNIAGININQDIIEIYGNNPKAIKSAKPKCININEEDTKILQYLLNQGTNIKNGPINSKQRLETVSNGKTTSFFANIKPILETNISAFNI